MSNEDNSDEWRAIRAVAFRLIWQIRREKYRKAKLEAEIREILLTPENDIDSLPKEIDIDLYQKSLELVLNKASISQNWLSKKIGMNAFITEHLLNMMEEEFIISPPDHVGNRVVLATRHARSGDGQ